MSRKSETALLREELARLAVENQEPHRTISRLGAASGGRIAALEAEIDRLRLEMAERDRRTGKYENAHVPSSSGSLYNEKRAAFRKMMRRRVAMPTRVTMETDLNRMVMATVGRQRMGRPAGGRRPDMWAPPTRTRLTGRSCYGSTGATHAGAATSGRCRR